MCVVMMAFSLSDTIVGEPGVSFLLLLLLVYVEFSRDAAIGSVYILKLSALAALLGWSSMLSNFRSSSALLRDLN